MLTSGIQKYSQKTRRGRFEICNYEYNHFLQTRDRVGYNMIKSNNACKLN